MPERLVLCGDVQSHRDEGALRLALDGPNKNINFEIDKIPVRLCAPLTPHLGDLLEIATFVYCADQATSRGGNVQSGMGASWRRDFRFVVPVRDPDHWSRPEVAERLSATLGFLSDDNYRFEFEALTDPPPGQAYFPFDEAAAAFKPNVAIPFSGGLDSLAGAIEELASHDSTVVLVSHRPATKILVHQNKLVKGLNARFPGKVLHIPVLVNMQAALAAKDYNQRSRSFLYAAMVAATAHTLGIDRVRFFENGVVSINLPITEQVVGSRATRTTHPRVIKGFTGFFGAALERPIEVENPYIWRTKRDVIDVITKNKFGSLIEDSVSCTRVHQMTKRHTHCGRCSQCIDRRFAILSANAECHDSGDKYAYDLLVSAREDELDRTMAESYVRTAVQMSRMNDIAFFDRFGGNVATLLDCFAGLSADDVGQATYDLHQRHAANVTSVLEAAVAKQSADLVAQRLPASSIVVMSVSRGAADAKPAAPKPVADFWQESEEPDLPESTNDPLPLQLALDAHTGEAFIRGVTRFSRADSKLILALEITLREDRDAGRAPENYRYLKSDELASRLQYADEVTVRQRVSTCRREVATAFRGIHDRELPKGSLIQSCRPNGYRLNPQILLVASSEVPEEDASSHKRTSAVTHRGARA